MLRSHNLIGHTGLTIARLTIRECVSKTIKGLIKMTDTATLHADGRVTVPREIRAALGLLPGDKLAFTLHGNGDLVMRKANIDLADITQQS
ncbi:MAG: AbrB/MazE/SpoVT family DNA-binding domain-containing protein [Burkholderiaceae bacterium]|nr:MAG: AbrB/MazE/SpoVT family DNA-binding domain-containing protein [Burkholderiaceae bacterium]TAM04868.1 MAG: AbrB/MazE/SpoVT family DNA-binding domain-containing protein [Pusillimonas sp.]